MAALMDEHKAYGDLKLAEAARRLTVHPTLTISGHMGSKIHFTFLPEIQEAEGLWLCWQGDHVFTYICVTKN